MYQHTAAHRTVALGTQALVTNMDTGESVHVRINDRGPHRRNRILDLSYESARQLSLIRPGSGRVKIEFLSVAMTEPVRQVKSIPVAAEPPYAVPILQTPVSQPYIVQAGAYQYQSNAERAQQNLTSVHPRIWITMAPESAQPLHRVRLGPFPSRNDAERVVHEVKARGYTAVIVPMSQ